ncbi:MAG: DUF1501 domain-containing protein [Alphaproteobacteria bacterium]|nr:DUF1501 domain-containing protein [Alphaproteobacteria bacterium]
MPGENETDKKKLIDAIISRRRVLQGAGMLAAGAMLPLFSGMKVAFADAPVEQRFIFVILRGAMDGLGAIPPYGDRHYKEARNGLALPSSAYAPITDFFGAHKNLANFTQMFKSGEAAAVQAVSTPYRERSHFDAQNVLESGGDAPHLIKTGWLNRALALYGAPRDSGLGISIGQTIPLSMQGDVSVGTWAPSAQGLPEDTLLIALDKIYQHDPLLHGALVQAVDVHNIADDALGNGGKMRGNANLRNKQAMQKTVQAVGRILSDPKGPRIATIEVGGWDTHAQQGTENGALPNNLAALDAGFGEIKKAMGRLWGKTVVFAATEFGRTVAQNGTNGTDHGTASCAFLLGGAVRGGKVYTKWPGLDKTQLYQNRDLRPTTDIRQVAKAILTDHLGLPSRDIDARVFPDSSDARALEGIIRT